MPNPFSRLFHGTTVPLQVAPRAAQVLYHAPPSLRAGGRAQLISGNVYVPQVNVDPPSGYSLSFIAAHTPLNHNPNDPGYGYWLPVGSITVTVLAFYPDGWAQVIVPQGTAFAHESDLVAQ